VDRREQRPVASSTDGRADMMAGPGAAPLERHAFTRQAADYLVVLGNDQLLAVLVKGVVLDRGMSGHGNDLLC
jgi:hypothetical protein